MGKFMRGADAAKEASKGLSFSRAEYLSMDDQEELILRFLTDADEWITVNQHQFVPTKPEPEDYQGNWPKSLPAVCRKTKMGDGSTLYDDCYICDEMEKKDGSAYKASARQWALACIREEVRNEDGEVIGIRDATREVAETDKDNKPTGETRTEKAIVIVNQGYKNFFSILQGFAGRYGTVLDRDYYIKREGDDTSTTYAIVPLDPIDAHDPDDEDKVVRFDLRDERFMARYEADAPDLEEVVLDKASEDFYGRFWVKGWKPKKKDSDDDDAPESADKPDNDVDDEDKLKAIADRVRGYGGGDDESSGESEKKDKPKVQALD